MVALDVGMVKPLRLPVKHALVIVAYQVETAPR